MKRNAGWVAGVVVAGLVGCGGEAHRLGGSELSATVSGDGGAPVGTVSTGGVPSGDASGAGTGGAGPTLGIQTGSGGDRSALLGTWTGYVENDQFASGSDVMTLTLSGADAGTTTLGHMTFGTGGTGSQLDPITDFSGGFGGGVNTAPTEGFPYAVEDSTLVGDRLQLDVDTYEVWDSWCAAQTPIPDVVNKGSYNCAPNVPSSGNSNGTDCTVRINGRAQPISCGQLDFCRSGPCSCTAAGCVMERSSIHFDMVVAPPKLDGSVAGLGGGVLNVHFTKQ